MLRFWRKSRKFRFMLKIEDGKLAAKPGSTLMQLGLDGAETLEKLVESFYEDNDLKSYLGTSVEDSDFASGAEEQIEHEENTELATDELLEEEKFDDEIEIPEDGEPNFEILFSSLPKNFYGVLDLVVWRGAKDDTGDSIEQVINDSKDQKLDNDIDNSIYSDLIFKPIDPMSVLKYFFEVEKIESFYDFNKKTTRLDKFFFKPKLLRPTILCSTRRVFFLASLFSSLRIYPGYQPLLDLRHLNNYLERLAGVSHTLRGRLKFKERKINFRRKLAKKQIYEY